MHTLTSSYVHPVRSLDIVHKEINKACSLVLKLRVLGSLYFQVLIGTLQHGVSCELRSF